MAKCKDMFSTYTMTNSGIYNGDITTNSNLDADYYRYNPQNVLNPPWHFTLGDTGQGENQQRSMGSMHFTVELTVGAGVANGHIFFNSAGTITGNNDSHLHEAARAAFQRYRADNGADIQRVITCMAGKLV